MTKLHSKHWISYTRKKPLTGVSIHDDIAFNAFQFSVMVVYEQLKTFSKHTAASPSELFQEHLQHAADCIARDRSEFALKAITKIVIFGNMELFPPFISIALCCASLMALSKKKSGRPICEMLRRLIAKCPANEAKPEAIELFDSLQLGVGVSGGAEAIIHSSKITYDNKVSAQSDDGVLQIDFQKRFQHSQTFKLIKSNLWIYFWNCRLHQFLLLPAHSTLF